jgi:hypothetical protein
MTAPLHYASPLPWYRAGRTQRIIIRLLILSALACGGIWALRFVQQLRFLYQQHQWMQYTMPPDKIVPASASAGWPKEIAPIPWAANASLVFIHHLRAEGNHDRLVSVVIQPQQSLPATLPMGFGGIDHWAYQGQLIALAQIPADLRLGSRPTPCSPFGSSGELDVPGSLFAGQPDPSDESHFTIRYESDGKSNLIDGWLMPDDTVKLEPRK